MDEPASIEIDDGDAPPALSVEEMRVMLEQSKREIAEGRTVPLAPVLERMRVIADRIGRERAAASGSASSCR